MKTLVDFCHFELLESKNYQEMLLETSNLSLFWGIFLQGLQEQKLTHYSILVIQMKILILMQLATKDSISPNFLC